MIVSPEETIKCRFMVSFYHTIGKHIELEWQTILILYNKGPAGSFCQTDALDINLSHSIYLLKEDHFRLKVVGNF